jgi:2,3-bisphosphoglycerate-independent phosphoglycerate mutase
MTQGIGEYYSDPFEGIKASYAKDVTDEFMVPFISDKNGMIEDGDSVVFANFRPDRAIQIATALSNPNGLVYNPLKPYKLDTTKGPKKTFFVSMMKYSDTVLGELAFGVQKLTNLMGDIVANNNMTQLRIAETEKYAHVTFFYDGGEDRTIKGADRILVNTPKVATYDLKPEMSAFEVRDKVVAAIKEEKYDMIILNFANCDMVGHTGVIPAAVKAVEAVDQCVGDVVRALDQVGGVAVITADHGNAEKLRDADGKPFTAHTTNPVPVVITDKNIKIRDGILSDLAPTMLELLGIEKPADMTSESIIVKK